MSVTSDSTQKSVQQESFVQDATSWLEIDPQAADVASIEERIQAKLLQHDPSDLPHESPAKLAYQLRAKMLGDQSNATVLDELENLGLDPDLLRHIQQANESNTAFDLSSALTDSSASSVPLFGRLWHKFQKSAHELVLFYTNSATEQQVNVNIEMLNALNRLTVLVREQQEYIDLLREQIDSPTHSTSSR